jgi:hypothetical protein
MILKESALFFNSADFRNVDNSFHTVNSLKLPFPQRILISRADGIVDFFKVIHTEIHSVFPAFF